MRCINAIGGFSHGFDLVGQSGQFSLVVGGATTIATCSRLNFREIEQAGHGTAENMVIQLDAWRNRDRKAPRDHLAHRDISKVTIERADVAMASGRVVLLPELKAHADCPDILVLFCTDYLKYAGSGFIALDGAEILGRVQTRATEQEVMLARMTPGSSLRGYIDQLAVNSRQPMRQYISNLAFDDNGRDLSSHG